MSNWAEIDENNVVVRVVVGDDSFPDEGRQWLIDNLGGRWIKTSYNTVEGKHVLGGKPVRGTYAGENYIYDEMLDKFFPPSPYPSWVLDTDTCVWNPPIPVPSDTTGWIWDESIQDWSVREL